MNSRRDFLRDSAIAAAAVAAGASLPALAEPSARKPNIILILTDDMGYSDIGCYGSEIDTPNLDRLAKNGLQFSSYYNCPRCCPSRASLMTGMYSHQAHMGMMVDDHKTYGKEFPSYDGDLNKACFTIAEGLKPAGYRTYHSGKWHLSAEQTTEGTNLDKSNWPCQRGFDHGYSMITGAGSYYHPNTLTMDNEPINEFPKDFYFTNAIAEKGLEMIQQGPQDQPFFWYCAFNAAHWPLQAPEDVIAKYRERYMDGWDKMRASRHAKQIKSGLLKAEWKMTPRDPRVPAWGRASFKKWEAERMAVYAAQIDIMDQNVGKIIKHLEETKQLDNTLIFFLADNGGNYEEFNPKAYEDGEKRPLFIQPGKVRMGNDPSIMPGPADTYTSYGGPWGNVSNTPFRMYKHYAHEGGISTPLIAHWPAAMKTTPGIKHQLGHEFDIMPTCLEAAGTTPPKTTKAGTPPLPLEGKSILPVFRGEAISDRGMIFWEHEGNCAVRDGKWKLVSKWPDTWELYDMDADRSELHDLADEMPERVVSMSKSYREWAARVGAQPWPMPQTPNGGRIELPLPDYLKHDRW
jgi:arylsulfatase A-like enzyme